MRTIRGRRPLIWTAILLVTAIVAGGTTWLALDRDATGELATVPTPPPSKPVPADDPELLTAVDAILRERARAVLTGRQDLFLRGVDPHNAGFLAAERQVYANLRVLRPAELSFLRHTYWPEPRVQQQHGPAAHAFLVVMRIRLAGLDSSARVTEVGYSFARRGGRYLLVDDDDIDPDLGVGQHREPWDFGPIEVARAPGVLIVVSRGEGKLARRLARDATAALPPVRRLTRRPVKGLLVIALKDRRTLDDWRSGSGSAAAVAAPSLLPVTPRSRSAYRVVGSRVIVNPAYRSRMDRALFAHEFTHAAWATIRHAPSWLVEGYATLVQMDVMVDAGYGDWVDRHRRKVFTRSIPGLTGLPIDGLFHGDYGEDSYGISWVIVEYLVDEYELDGVMEFYADHTSARDESVLLRKHFGVDEKALLAAVKRQH
jgi:hypothetical protein